MRALLSNSATIKLLDVKLDPDISMNRHVMEMVQSCNYHIRALRHISPLLTLDYTKMAEKAFSVSAPKI